MYLVYGVLLCGEWFNWWFSNVGGRGGGCMVWWKW